MTGRFPRRSTMFATVVAAATLGAIGFAGISFGAVIVGETRGIDLAPAATPGSESKTVQQRRPGTFPFPKANTHTPEKDAPGKKLYFDTRLSVTPAHACANGHNPGFGCGDGLA